MISEDYIKTAKNDFCREILYSINALGIKSKIVSEKYRIIKLEYKERERLLYQDWIIINKHPSTKLTKNKDLTKQVLAEEGIIVPRGIMVDDHSHVMEDLKKNNISFPVVVKPAGGKKGARVFVGIDNEEQLAKAIEECRKFCQDVKNDCSEGVMVEEMVEGQDYRVLVLDDEVIACIERTPANIVGDGEKTIKELIELYNIDRPGAYLLQLDQEAAEAIAQAGHDYDSVLPKDKKIYLRKSANKSMGGQSIDLSNKISKRFSNIAKKSARVIGLRCAGVDLLTEDITSEDPAVSYWVLEVNGSPGFDLASKPLDYGKRVNLAELLLLRFMEDE